MKRVPKIELRGNVGGSDGDEVFSATEKASLKLSPTSHWHDKCVAGYDLERETRKKTKKKSMKKYPEEVVRFVEGTPSFSVTSGKSLINQNWKTPKYNTEIRFLEHKYIQCNIINAMEDADMILPEEIKPLLVKVTFLLHEVKQRPESKNQEELCSIISKIATLLAELSRRPIKRSEDMSKPFDDIAGKLGAILKEHSGPVNDHYQTLLMEIKRLEQEVKQKDSEVIYVKQQIEEERARFMPESKCLDDRLRNSILKNHSLKAEIKYNKAQFRKYEKILAQKEQLRQKSMLELNNLKRKCARIEQRLETNTKPAYMRLYHADSDVYHGGSLTKYIKSKVYKDNKKITKVKTTIN